MPEIRHNIITREWVIIATERAKRPDQFVSEHPPRTQLLSYDPKCPFCPGNEHLTPPETWRLGKNGRWSVRVVPNKFAALDPAAELTRHADGIKRSISGAGLHEVIIETPDHNRTLALLSEEEFFGVLQTYVRRYLKVTSDPRVAHATLFRNHGLRAGTSLEHPHSQIVGTPIIPPQVRDRMETALRFFDENGECIFCSVMADELLDQTRVIAQSEHFVAFIPYAALSPFATWIYPLHHTANFGDTPESELADFSRLLRLVLRKIHFSLRDPDYNLTLRTPPREASGLRYYHWYASIIPRVTRVAGFELGSGMFINPALPETSAAFLRSAPADPA